MSELLVIKSGSENVRLTGERARGWGCVVVIEIPNSRFKKETLYK